ncbi:MAG: hypothetical protein GX589_00360 [Deltaproteobacteria bacterium]|nr:hypothetical protein [Deltaproteobacteria bacterium]
MAGCRSFIMVVCSAAAVFCLLFKTSLSYSAPLEIMSAEVSEGMAFKQVLDAWGAPLEKHELETKRENIWIYQTKKVIFKEGRVVQVQDLSVALPGGGVVTAVKSNNAAEPSPQGSEPVADPGAEVIADILTEIMKGSSETSVSDKAPGTARRPTPNQPTFIEEPQLGRDSGEGRAW